ncbi:uncharacterized protein FSUBG_7904 [Fusarium subglutinans]|uniref:MACPF-like domain-containing protein n=1 Tax=Gibberella subglutinans TaxID=42677 RepID=A0A8H5PSY0_GIBSU|nr:uncharacterized protein FSUBG_7904 [Fusarium subglutinans]KAF5602069.1 hypothetical protein FSUBG_7904 [Fusarium subglutinans]
MSAEPPKEAKEDVFVKVYSLTTAPKQGQDGDTSVAIGRMAVTTLKFADEASTFQSRITLAEIRTKINEALSSEQTFKFCADDYSLVPEDVTLETYKKMMRSSAMREAKIPTVLIAPTSEPASSQSAALKDSFIMKFIQVGDNPENAKNVGSLHASAFKGKDPSTMLLGELRRLIGKMSADPKMHTFCSLDGTAAGDELTLQKYLALDNAKVDPSDGTPAILIRYRSSDAKVSAAASKFHGASQDVLQAMEQMKPDLSFKDRSAEEMHADTTALQVQENLRASDIAAREASPLKYTSQMDEADWDSVLRNCCLLYGWKVDKGTKRIVRATTPAFRLRNKLPPRPIAFPAPAIQQPVISPETSTETSVASTPGTDKSPDTSGDASAEGQETEGAVKTEKPTITENSEAAVDIDKPLTAEDVEAPIPTKLGAIPSYAINDRSRIEITMVSNEFQESMARNHFSASSVEASASGGWSGYSVGVTGGAAQENTSGGTKTQKGYAKRMFGSYMFPRVDVFLRPEDLEPTEELRAALDGIKQTKNINALRELYSTFGHLFCHSVTLGGCLQTTKVVESDEAVQQSKDKQSFKAQLGVAVSTPFGAKGNVKGSKESQDGGESHSRSAKANESMGFEATGGNSILAADPPAWSGSVANFNNWRIIEQTELTPIVDAISKMTGYRETRSWFFAAAPKLSEYMVIPESRMLHVRFKVASQNESFGVISQKKIPAYLGHRPNESVTPVRTNLRVPDQPPKEAFRNGPFGLIGDMTKITAQNPGASTTPLFEPNRTQTPILMFPSGAELGTKTDNAFSHVVWRLEIARGHSIGPDTLLCIKSAALPKADLALTVYRNAQGVYLPSISSTDEPCYWRLEPAETSGISRMKGDRYKFGDSFRLTWSFSDQTSGFRDFVDDSYGRRNLTRPSDIKSDKLCLKVPFPRFESMSSDYMAVLMSPALTTDPIIEKIKVLDGFNQEKTYNFHDLTFRVDLVGNDGNGDKNDYANLAATTWEELDKKLTPGEKLLGNILGPSPMVIDGVLGGMEFTRW